MEFAATFVNLIPVAVVQSLIFGFVALAIMVPFRVLNFPDLTSEGSFTLGACSCAAMLSAGFDPVTATLGAMAAGFGAGCATGYIHEKARVNTLLCGILVLTMLYSVNIRIMGQPNLPLYGHASLFSRMLGGHGNESWYQAALLGTIAVAAALAWRWFLRTQIGLAMRAVGAGTAMARAQGVAIGVYTIAGLGLANALAGLSGALLAQSQGFADVNMGFGVLLNGLAALILGEAVVGRDTLMRQILAPFAGSALYFQLVSLALAVGMQPSDLKLGTGLFILAALLIPAVRGRSAMGLRIRE